MSAYKVEVRETIETVARARRLGDLQIIRDLESEDNGEPNAEKKKILRPEKKSFSSAKRLAFLANPLPSK